MHTRIVVPVFLCVFALLGGCASSAPAKPESRIDPSANIPASKTFGWQPAGNNLVSTDVTQRKFDESIRDSINTDLGRKGYAQAEAEPDLLVAYEVTPYEKTKSNPFSVGVGMGSWGGNVGGGVGVGTGGGSSKVQETRLIDSRGRPQDRQGSVARHDDQLDCTGRQPQRHRRCGRANAGRLSGASALSPRCASSAPLVRASSVPRRPSRV